jgi:hypothetical protein
LAQSKEGEIYLSAQNSKGEIIFWSSEKKTFKVIDKGSHPKLKLGSRGEIYLVYSKRTADGYGSNVYFTASFDKGRSFIQPQKINDLPISSAYHPAIAIDDGNQIYIVWSECGEKGFFKIMFDIINIPLGNSGKDKKISIGDNNFTCDKPTITFSGGYIYIAWHGLVWEEIREDKLTPNDDFGIYGVYSQDRGNSFTSPQRIASGEYPTITSDKEHVFLTYSSPQGIGFSFTKLGSNFSKVTSISNGEIGRHPAIVTWNNNVVIVWQTPKNILRKRHGMIKEKEVSVITPPYPNPFNSTYFFTCWIGKRGIGEIRIYNLLGQRIGIHRYFNFANSQNVLPKVIFGDGRDEKGRKLSSGIYFFTAAGRTFKGLLLK